MNISNGFNHTFKTSINGNLSNHIPTSCPASEFNGFHIALSTAGILIIAINLFLFFFISCSRQLRRNANNLILIGLSLNDTITGLCLFLHMVPNYYYVYEKCTQAIIERMMVVNNVAYFINKITLLCTVGQLLLLAAERMIGLFLPLHYKSMVVTKRTQTAVVTVWVISIVIPPIELSYQKSQNVELFAKIQAGFTVIGFGLIPTILLCLQYIAMLSVIYKFQSTRTAKFKTIFEKHKAFFIYFIMFLSFLFLTMPYFAVRCIVVFTTGFSNVPLLLIQVIVALRYVPSLVNPFVYAVLKDDFRRAFVKWKRYYTRKSNSEFDTTQTFLLSRKETKHRSTVVIKKMDLSQANKWGFIKNTMLILRSIMLITL